MRRLYILIGVLLAAFTASGRNDSLLRAAQNMPATDTNLTYAYTAIAWSYLAENDTANTLLYLRKSAALSEKLGYDRGLMNAYSSTGGYYTRFGKIDSAVYYFALCLAKAKDVNDVKVASKTSANLAGAYLSYGDYALAVQYYLEAIKYLERTNDQEKIAGNYHCLGIAYYMLKNYPLSLKYYNKSLETGLAIGKQDKTGYNYNGIGVVYKELKQYDSALYYLGKGYTDATANSDVYLLSHNLSNTGEVYSILGRVPEALASLSKAMLLQQQGNDRRGVAETAVLLGGVYAGTKNYSSALKYYDSAHHIADAIGAKDVQKNAWKGLADVYQHTGNATAALDAYRHYADLKDTLYTEESSRQIAEMQTKYNTEKKEKENALLQKENTVKDLQLVKEKGQERIIIVSFVFVAIASRIYYNRYRLKQKNDLLKEREMRAYAVLQAQEDEKGKLSKDLHDGVGALLSLIKLNISSINADAGNEKILASTKNLATDAIKEIRGISHELMPSVLSKSGLNAALVEMAESVNTSGSLNVELVYTLTERMAQEVESNVFRIIQEATNNVIKHADATKEKVTVTLSGGYLHVGVQDNGKGFDQRLLSKITGNGLNNILSRVNVLKGEMDVVTGPGDGTQINIRVPVKNKTNA